MKTDADYSDWVNNEVIDANGESIGKIKEVLVDDVTGKPDWVTVSLGILGTNRQFVPIAGANTVGERLEVPYTLDHIENAPSIDIDDDHLGVRSERRLYEHYGLHIDDGPERGNQAPDE